MTCPSIRNIRSQLGKLEINAIVGKNLQWPKKYLNNTKQYIQINNEEKANLLLVKYGVPRKTKYSFFHKRSKKDDIPLLLPKLKINNYEIKRTESIPLYYSYIHSYINYANVAWESTYMTNSKRLFIQQKHEMRIICNKERLKHT